MEPGVPTPVLDHSISGSHRLFPCPALPGCRYSPQYCSRPPPPSTGTLFVPSTHTLAGEPGVRTLGLRFCFTPGLLEVGTCLCLYEVAQRLLFNPFYGNSQTLPSGSSSQEMPDLRFRLSSSCLLCLTFATVGWTGNGSMSREQGLGASFGAHVHPLLSLLSSRQAVPGCLLCLSFP